MAIISAVHKKELDKNQNAEQIQSVTGAIKPQSSRSNLFLVAKEDQLAPTTKPHYASAAVAEFLKNKGNVIADMVCGKSPAGLIKLPSLSTKAA
jgi:hypothetical protein